MITGFRIAVAAALLAAPLLLTAQSAEARSRGAQAQQTASADGSTVDPVAPRHGRRSTRASRRADNRSPAPAHRSHGHRAAPAAG